MSRLFSSRDANVSIVIDNCTAQWSKAVPRWRCAWTLQCVLASVDAATTTRWSAGASILAFIPTVTAFFHNSIEEMFQIADESPLLAVLLALGSVGVVMPRFGNAGGLHLAQHMDLVKLDIRDNVERVLEQACSSIDNADASLTSPSSHTTKRTILVCSSTFLMLPTIAMLWLPVYQLVHYGVVVFSCPYRVHVILWVALVQLQLITNILLFRRYSVRTKTISLQCPSLPSTGDDHSSQVSTKPSSAPPVWPENMVLRSTQVGKTPQLIRGCNAILSLALYTFATGVLSSTTLIPASDAIRIMVLFSVSSAVVRIIAAAFIESPHRRDLTIQVRPENLEVLRAYTQATVAEKWRSCCEVYRLSPRLT